MSVAYRAFYAIPELNTKAGTPTNAVLGFVKMLKQAIGAWRPSHLAVAFDGGLSAAKLDLLKDYKAQRPAMPPRLRSQLPLIDEFLDASGIKWILIDREEADDVIASLVAREHDSVERILIGSSDKDLYQLVDEKVQVIGMSASQTTVMTVEDVRNKTGVGPGQIVDWLAMVGDSSDNIPGVRGVGPKTAAALLNQFGSWEGIAAKLADIKLDRARAAIEGGLDVVERNRKMVALRKDLEIEPSLEDMAMVKPDAGQLIELFEKLEFHSLAKELRAPELF